MSGEIICKIALQAKGLHKKIEFSSIKNNFLVHNGIEKRTRSWRFCTF